MTIIPWEKIEFWCPYFIPLHIIIFRGFSLTPLCTLYITTYIRGEISWEEKCHNFKLDLAPSHGACRVKSTPAGPSARNTQISQMGTILRFWFCLGRGKGPFVGRGWWHQCIIFPWWLPWYWVIYLTLMWQRRVLSRIFNLTEAPSWHKTFMQ